MMKPERELAVKCLQSMGWQAKRVKHGKTPVWELRRPDTDGLWDLTKIRQDELSLRRVAHVALQYGDAPDLQKEIDDATKKWIEQRFYGTLLRAKRECEETKESEG